MSENDLVVDLRGQRIESLEDFWDAVAGPCGLPDWFGRNLDAWYDTIDTRGISEVIDRHGLLVVQADREGLFARGNRDGIRLAEVFASSTQADLVLAD